MNQSKIVEHRRWIHQHAELSFEEFETQNYICRVLTELGIAHRRVANTGVLATIGHHSGRAVVLRADIDALPIAEHTNFDFSSVNEGVMHACGHDMHAAALLGALADLAQNPIEGCTVLGLFQPGEEMHPGGASMVLSQGVFDGYDIVAVVGQHCSPELEVGRFGLCAGQFMASTDEIHIRLVGRGGHAAQPALLRNPVIATAALLMEMDKIRPANDSAHVLAFGRVVADGATNIIPDEVYVEGTFRTFDQQWRTECKTVVRRVAAEVGQRYGVAVEVDIKDGYPSVFNDIHLTDVAREVIGEEFGAQAVVDIPKRMTAEDFGFYAQRYPSLFVRLGVGPNGEQPTQLHTSTFCADERALSFGAKLLTILARKFSKQLRNKF